MNGNIKAYNIKLLETGSIIGSVKADIFEVFGYVEGETEAGDVKIGKTATIKGDVFFKENLKIDEGADVDGYLKDLLITRQNLRLLQNNHLLKKQIRTQ